MSATVLSIIAAILVTTGIVQLLQGTDRPRHRAVRRSRVGRAGRLQRLPTPGGVNRPAIAFSENLDTARCSIPATTTNARSNTP